MEKLKSLMKLLPKASGDPKPFYAMLGTGMLMVVVSFTLATGSQELSTLEDRHAELMDEVVGLEQSIAEKQMAQDEKKTEAVIEATGLDPALINIDTSAASTYFANAFDWSSGEDYDNARNAYDETLGEGNSFTKTYFPENTKIETSDGEENFIDYTGLRSTMDNITIVPLTAQGDRVRYVAFVRYFMFKNAEDVNNTSALTPSDAIIEFTASGDPDGQRDVSEVEAWAGFNSTLDE